MQLESGERVRYERLVIATGARCDATGIAGAQLPHVFTLHTLDDAERMRRFLRERRPQTRGGDRRRVHRRGSGRRAAAAAACASPSWSARAMRCCATMPQFTAAVRKQLELHGVELRTVRRPRSSDRSTSVPCDMVVLAAGFKPNVELAAEAGVELGRTGAIRTDERMETNLRGVYAAGRLRRSHAPGHRPADLHSAGHHGQ